MLKNLLIVHHVGGRAGSRCFPVLNAFEKDIVNVMYEADESCVDQVTENWKAQKSITKVLPYCLSSGQGVSKFHINYDPYTSSIYKLNPRYADFYYKYPGRVFDYVLGDTFRTVRELNLQTTTLDAVVLENDLVPAPDFLSIDTQGSELDILNGSSDCLAKNILAVHAEIELHPLYENQPLFGDICQFMTKHNFDLVDINLFSKLLPSRGKQGFRGEGYVAHGEALFLKRVDTVTDSIQLNKLAFIATVFGQFECAQQCFESNHFKNLSPLENSACEPSPRYLEFVSRLACAVDKLPQRSNPLFSDFYSFSQSDARFRIQTNNDSTVKIFLKTITPLVAFVRLLRSMKGLLEDNLLRVYALKIPLLINIGWWLRYSSSEVEALFIEFRMKEQYRLAMKNRIEDSWALDKGPAKQ
jgi:FkbM family methyltransferase